MDQEIHVSSILNFARRNIKTQIIDTNNIYIPKTNSFRIYLLPSSSVIHIITKFDFHKKKKKLRIN